jgi:hypothetical protein
MTFYEAVKFDWRFWVESPEPRGARFTVHEKVPAYFTYPTMFWLNPPHHQRSPLVTAAEETLDTYSQCAILKEEIVARQEQGN